MSKSSSSKSPRIGTLRYAAFKATYGTLKKDDFRPFSESQADLLLIANLGRKIAPDEYADFKKLAGLYIDPRIEKMVGGGKGVKYLRRVAMRRGISAAQESKRPRKQALAEFAAVKGLSETSLLRWRASEKKTNKFNDN